MATSESSKKRAPKRGQSPNTGSAVRIKRDFEAEWEDLGGSMLQLRTPDGTRFRIRVVERPNGDAVEVAAEWESGGTSAATELLVTPRASNMVEVSAPASWKRRRAETLLSIAEGLSQDHLKEMFSEDEARDLRDTILRWFPAIRDMVGGFDEG